MAEDQKAIEPPLPLQGDEAEQGPQGFARTRSCMDQHVMAARLVVEQAGPQQLDQAALPLPGSHGGCCGRRDAQVEGRKSHHAIVARGALASAGHLQMGDLAYGLMAQRA